MIDLENLYVRAFLDQVALRVALTSETLSWVDGEPVLIADELVPPFTEGSEAERAFLRYSRQVQSLAPRALRIRRQGAIGTITWSEVPSSYDEILDRLPLRRLARDATKDLLANGIAAAWPIMRQPLEGSAAPARPLLQRLGGHLELIWREDDVAGDPIGLLQITGSAATHHGKGLRYDVRVYDFEETALRVWRALRTPTDLGGDPDATYPENGETLIMPTVVWAELDQSGYPVGELKQALPLFKQELAEAIRVLRTSDAHSYPIWTLVGSFEEPKRLGPNIVLRAKSSDARAERVAPGDLSPLFAEGDRTQDRIRTDLLLPITTGGQIPSGEALVQANASYNGASDDLARLLSELMSDAVRGYFELLELDLEPGFLVTVKPDRELKRLTIAMQVREDFRAGLVNHEIALGELEQFYPNMDSAMLARWLEETQTLPEPTAAPSGAFANAEL
ncbi:hypothetical protein [Natronococcus sp.]|uniref:hypothetical protein n=1 Tax=Natronococcus sp. TaxID=35747 RepID=UPI003A4DF2E5